MYMWQHGEASTLRFTFHFEGLSENPKEIDIHWKI